MNMPIHRARPGSALVTVLIVIVMLTLGAYSFTEFMLIEVTGAERATRLAQAQAAADSGVEYAATYLSNREEMLFANLFHNPDQFGGVILRDADTSRSRARFTFIAPVESDMTASQVRFGFVDESSKLNVNAIPNFNLSDSEQREMLLAIPGMTSSIADSILDWIDSDNQQREFGAESRTYEGYDPPYSAANRPIESLEELLKVNGVTPELVYGEDLNRNGLLDPNENDGERSPPYDNADGILDLGWRAYLTCYSRESNLRLDGSPRIDVNQGFMTELYDQIAAEYDEEVARFVVAYRIYGATNVEPIEDAGVDQGTTTGNTMMDQFLGRAAEGVAQALFSDEGATTTRGGLDLSQPAQVEIYSLYDLIDAEVDAEVDGITQTLNSPWTSDYGSLSTSIPDLLENFSTSSVEFIEGRININQARLEVLLGIPNMPEDLARTIVSQRPVDGNGQPLAQLSEAHQTTAWIFVEGYTDLVTLRRLDRFITSRGEVHSVQVLGHFDTGGPVSRVEAIIDASTSPARVIFQRDISHLGAGYQVSRLLGLE